MIAEHTFPAIKNADFQIILEGSSDNWSEDFESFAYDVSMS